MKKIKILSYFWLISVLAAFLLKWALFPVVIAIRNNATTAELVAIASPFVVVVVLSIWTGMQVVLYRLRYKPILTRTWSAFVAAFFGFLTDFFLTLWIPWDYASFFGSRYQTFLEFLSAQYLGFWLTSILYSISGAVAGALAGFGFSYAFDKKADSGRR